MDLTSKRSGLITSLLVGLVLLITGLGLFVAFVPVSECPGCEHGQRVLGVHGGPISTIHGLEVCERCKGKGKLSILNRWVSRQHYAGPYSPPTGPRMKAPRIEITITFPPVVIPDEKFKLPEEKK